VKKNLKSKFEKYLLIDWKEFYLLLILWVLFLVLHHMIENLFIIKEAFLYFIATRIIPLFFVITLIYTVTHHHKRQLHEHRKKK